MPNNTFEQRTDGFWYAPAKDPNDVLDYIIDLTGVLEDEQDALASVIVTLNDPSSSLTLIRTLINGQRFSLWFSGGLLGTSPDVNFLATSQNGRVVDRDFRIDIRNL
jgi:hypothetical protein